MNILSNPHFLLLDQVTKGLAQHIHDNKSANLLLLDRGPVLWGVPEKALRGKLVGLHTVEWICEPVILEMNLVCDVWMPEQAIGDYWVQVITYYLQRQVAENINTTSMTKHFRPTCYFSIEDLPFEVPEEALCGKLVGLHTVGSTYDCVMLEMGTINNILSRQEKLFARTK